MFNFMLFVSFSSLIPLAGTSSRILNIHNEKRYPYLISSSREKNPLLLLTIMLAVNLSPCLFVTLRKSPAIFSLLTFSLLRSNMFSCDFIFFSFLSSFDYLNIFVIPFQLYLSLATHFCYIKYLSKRLKIRKNLFCVIQIPIIPVTSHSLLLFLLLSLSLSLFFSFLLSVTFIQFQILAPFASQNFGLYFFQFICAYSWFL